MVDPEFVAPILFGNKKCRFPTAADHSKAGGGRDLNREGSLAPLLFSRLPDPADSCFGIADNDVHETVIINIEKSYAVVTAIRFANRVSRKKVFCHERMHLAHVEKFDLFPMDPVGVVNDLYHLSITHPVASVETK